LTTSSRPSSSKPSIFFWAATWASSVLKVAKPNPNRKENTEYNIKSGETSRECGERAVPESSVQFERREKMRKKRKKKRGKKLPRDPPFERPVRRVTTWASIRSKPAKRLARSSSSVEKGRLATNRVVFESGLIAGDTETKNRSKQTRKATGGGRSNTTNNEA
jgi:hypothetical protein